jgi:hypothetical protein
VKSRAERTLRPTFSTAWAGFHMHQCLVAAFALACARKKRIISRLASGPRASIPCVEVPTGLIERNGSMPPDRRIEFASAFIWATSSRRP